MAKNPIRLGTAALSNRIFAGYPNKKGDAFRGERHDVTGDVLKVIAEHIGIGHEVTVNCDGIPLYRIAILPVEAAKEGTDAA